MAEDSKIPDHSLVNNMYVDDKDFLAKYLFNPEILDDADFKHIDKNLAVTRLSSRYKEPERARSLLSALHVLNNNAYFRDVIKEEVDGYEDVNALFYSCPVCGRQGLVKDEQTAVTCCEKKPLQVQQTVISRPKTRKVIKNKSKFPKTYHMLKAMFYSFTTTSMARDGHLIRQATTTHFQQSQTMEDRTKVKGGVFSIGNSSKDKNNRW